ncbi:MAG TPA: SprT family zinc-dependent metalloprotease [Vicinamibacterales bacterium]
MQLGLPFGRDVEAVTPALTHVTVFARHPRARRYIIRVRDDGSVRVTVPRWGSRREATAFIEQERPWITRQRERLERERSADRERTAQLPWANADVARDARKRAVRELPSRLLALAAELGMSVTNVSVRNQKRRWGSCSPNGHICLNWRLVLMPDAVRDYVLIHELMHLRRMDHSPAFWKLVAKSCPDYQAHRSFLRSRSLD